MAYTREVRSNVKFLSAENEKMAKNLYASRTKAEQIREKNAVSVMTEMRKMIIDEISTLETNMRNLYDEFITIYKEFFHVHGL